MRVLWLSHWFPYPPDNGAKLRIYHLMQQLAKRHEVGMIGFANPLPETAHIQTLESVCRVIKTIPGPTFHKQGLSGLTGYFAPMPRHLVNSYEPALAAAVAECVTSGWPDIIITHEAGPVGGVSHYALPYPHLPRVMEDLELAAYQEARNSAQGMKARLGWGMRWWKTAQYVRRLLAEFDACTVPSEEERTCIARVAPAHRAALPVIPNGADVASLEGEYGEPEADTLIFSGALSFNFNFEAMQFFLAEVWPLIRQQRPQVRLRITGKTDAATQQRLPAHPGVVFTGYVDDIRPVIARSAVSIAPLLQGGGTRLKILEAMALGVPVVATSKGAEGIAAVPEHDILIADTPQAFADAVLRLLQDAALRERIHQRALELVKAKYDWRTIGGQFADMLEQVRANHQK
ncbi:MAG: glycosyltransferase family 4 protein [Anaerolineae bacterium]|nr:glycosyltransferase family 4 protein [Anaerolineae bacterium]